MDLSPLAADSLRCGLALLAGVTSEQLPELIIFHADDDGQEDPDAHSLESMATFLEEHTADYEGTVRSLVREGDATAEILAAGDQEEPDLLLMGTHGRSGWQRLRLGSVAESVIQHAPISVLVVPPSAAFGSGIAEAVGGWARCPR